MRSATLPSSAKPERDHRTRPGSQRDHQRPGELLQARRHDQRVTRRARAYSSAANSCARRSRRNDMPTPGTKANVRARSGPRGSADCLGLRRGPLRAPARRRPLSSSRWTKSPVETTTWGRMKPMVHETGAGSSMTHASRDERIERSDSTAAPSRLQRVEPPARATHRLKKANPANNTRPTWCRRGGTTRPCWPRRAGPAGNLQSSCRPDGLC